MGNLVDTVILVCALVGALAFGILTAYAILRLCFVLMRPSRPSAAVKPEPETARIA